MHRQTIFLIDTENADHTPALPDAHLRARITKWVLRARRPQLLWLSNQLKRAPDRCEGVPMGAICAPNGER